MSSAIGALLRADARSLLRDPLLGWIMLLPIGLALLLRVLVPPLSTAFQVSAPSDPGSLHTLIMGGYLLTAPGIVGMVVGFLLLDERDARTLTALRVSPLPLEGYIAYRVVLPLLLGTAATLIGYPLAGMVPLPPRDLLPLALLAGSSAPVMVLVLATAAPNKVAGFAVVKISNTVNLLPLVAFFLPLPQQLFAGFLPTYWPMRALWSAAAGEPYLVYLVAGWIVSLAALLAASRLFHRRLLRTGT
jgi:fluoroquinolone transport system permease protein